MVKQGYTFQNPITGEYWTLDMADPVPTGPGWDDHPLLQRHLQRCEEHQPVALAEARLVGRLAASVFDFVLHQREPVYLALRHLNYGDALLAAHEDGRMPLDYDWRVPLYEPELAPEVERFCQCYQAEFPIRRGSFASALQNAMNEPVRLQDMITRRG
ncbi:hypothetical protein Mlute_01795 [Meiothermus luteus]|jgi:hypothetical protein|uniref:Uncharacterized protein n=1 Tax=Meiothermus luteus TaxID=2026184 RepID=A0A399EMY2_9DEIN|nr:hypothetical protein [Meiothermus luteus]RIH84810.1 hypothetical protein Mlute_01795 [Meiothermus luteus]